jgi:hypothetical protein
MLIGMSMSICAARSWLPSSQGASVKTCLCWLKQLRTTNTETNLSPTERADLVRDPRFIAWVRSVQRLPEVDDPIPATQVVLRHITPCGGA